MHRKVTKFLSLFLSAAMMAGSLSVPAVAAEPAVYQESAAEETEVLPEETEAEESGAEETEALPEETEAEENGSEEADAEESAEQGEDQDTEDTDMDPEDAEAAQEETSDQEDADGAEKSAEEEPAAEAPPAEAEDTAPESADTAQETTATETVLGAEEVADSISDLTGQGYVLMNIPYADFYEAEGIDGVDIVSTATVKTYNQNMAGGSYHEGYEAADPISGAEILGVIYPVFVEDLSALQGMTQVTDADTATITVAAGKSSTITKEVSGKDLLFASGSYAFYILGEEPANYKTLSGSAGSYSFSSVKNGAQAAQIASADLAYGGHYTDLTLNVEADEVDDDAVVTGVVLTADGNDYVLRHVENIWRKTSLGWNWTDLDGAGLSGKTITAITYYLQDGGVYEYAVDVTVKKQLLSDAEAAFTDANTITVKGLPEDIQNPKATVSSVVGRGETAVVIADGADLVDGVVTTADAAVSGTKYNVKVVSDNYADVTMRAAFEDLQLISIAGLNYFYTDTKGDLDNTLYRATVSGRGGSTTYDFAKTDLTPIGETGYAYATAPNVTPLSGTLYGYGEGTATNYKEVYEKLGVSTDTDPAYDAVTSATGFTGHHAKDIPALVSYGTDADGEKAITGLTLGRASSTVDAVTYVEASILNAAGQSLTEDQTAALAVTLKANPMTAPSETEVNVGLSSASFASSRYGNAEFAIVPDDSVSGYVWSEYWNSVYAATISDGETTVGAVHWIDLYGEAATSGPHYNKVEIALNNGTSKGSNEAEVSRYAAFYDTNTGNIKAGTYTITIYAEGYSTLTAEVEVKAEAMSSVSIGGVNYYYADTTDDDAMTVYQATVRSKAGSTTYNYMKSDLTQVTDTDLYYISAPGATALTGTLYGYEAGSGNATNYKEVYGDLGASTDVDSAYDAVTSATGFTGHHAKDIPSLVTFGTDASGEKAITGLTLGRTTTTVDALTYVEAGVKQAAGKELTDEQTAAIAVTLTASPMTAPSDKEINVSLASASLASSRYGRAEFAIVPDDSVSGYVWSSYWNSIYGATISNGETTVGAVHWIDLYGEAATSGPHYNKVEIALNNGTSTGSNEAEVSRYASFFDGDYIKSGTYTITIYAEGYSPLTAQVAVDVKLSDKTAVYNGSEITADEAALTGIDGDVTYTYYSDEACTKVLESAPVNSGTYYVKAVAANLVASNPASLTIKKAAQSFTAKASAATVEVGKTVKVTVSGAKETNKYTFTSSDTKVAAVNASGVVTGKASGTVTITVKTAATANYEAGSKTVKITVNKTLKKPGNCHFTKWNNKQFTGCRISWNKVDGAEGYQTILSWTDGSHSSQTIVKPNVLYRDCTVVSNHVSQMKVRAFYTANGKRVYGPWSNIEYITPSPAKITAQNVSKGSNLKMKISWKPVYGCNGYNVFITTNPNGKWSWNQSTSTNAMSTSAVIEKCGGKLKKNTRYYVRIVTRRKRNGVFCTVPMPASNTYTGSFIIK